jgi:hypothetical protein
VCESGKVKHRRECLYDVYDVYDVYGAYDCVHVCLCAAAKENHIQVRT